MPGSHQDKDRKANQMVGRTLSSSESIGQAKVNELEIVGLIETMIIRRESLGNDVSKGVENRGRLVADLEVVLDR